MHIFFQSSLSSLFFFFFFFNDTATTEIYPLSLHDALPISSLVTTYSPSSTRVCRTPSWGATSIRWQTRVLRSEEHTSELQSLRHLVCRLLLEKKKKLRTKLVVLFAHQLRSRPESTRGNDVS